MISALKSYWNYGTTISSVEITSVVGDEWLFGFAAKKRKGEFEDLDFIACDSLSQLVEKLGKNRPIYLMINTDKVLIKTLPHNSNVQNLVSQAFPGLSSTEFYYDVHHSGDRSYISICRKDDVLYILEQAEKEGLNIIGFQLGFSSIVKILPNLNDGRVVTSRHQFEISNGEIMSFSSIKDPWEAYQIDDVTMGSEYLIALSGLFNYTDQKEDSFTNSSEKNQVLKKVYLEKNFFRKGLFIGIGILLLALITNLLFFTGYLKEYDRLNSEVELVSKQKESLTSKTSEVEGKERIVKNILSSGNSKSSFYINRIVDSRPASIVFSEILYQPLKKSIRPDKRIDYIKNEFLVSGASADKQAFSEWIEQLEERSWIENITVINYASSSSKIDDFSIKLLITNDTEK